ncbi:hypothetical protein P10VF_075 [Rhizobium phage vB_RleM_P10VF]|uniref:Uncharacterized protein n=1 Tax=Rhizobium phage vB_RleM_P10VF TaxID=1527770 RepID=A0A076YIP7_9CAUD|nr:hypothetical protein P10VF_075 [Rhizobium phage vB_RleM_P10VF]AIK68288.1 hypothetical protein P10VF_075 [Rhizobium phage vB_RleM_P10VF]
MNKFFVLTSDETEEERIFAGPFDTFEAADILLGHTMKWRKGVYRIVQSLKQVSNMEPDWQ